MDWRDLSKLDWTDPKVRISTTRYNPILFAELYLRPAITGQDRSISFAECHYEWASIALTWTEEHTEPQANRHAFFAPRSTGKSTWWLKILPMWAAAHGHVKFAAMFADTTTQARQHAATFRRELDNNRLLRHDFPLLCQASKRTNGKAEADTVDLMVRANGFVLAARGMDSGTLGMKVGDQRPDLLLIDDPEPDESNYSMPMVHKRLSTLTDAILPLNIFANVVYSGTVTMPGSIAHQLIKHSNGTSSEEWVEEQRFDVHHSPALLTNRDGSKRSLWPEKWPVEFLESIEHTRQYAKNYANDPMGADGDYWSPDDYVYDSSDVCSKVMISVDPAVTVRTSSDFTGVAVVGYCPGKRRCTVYEALQLKLTPEALRTRLIRLCEQYPNVGEIYVETNQGGMLWDRILHDMPVKVRATTATVKKEVRAADCLAHYQRGKVLHAKKLRDLEEQQVSFPKAPHDDMVDAVNQAVIKYLTNAPARIVVPTAGPSFPGLTAPYRL